MNKGGAEKFFLEKKTCKHNIQPILQIKRKCACQKPPRIASTAHQKKKARVSSRFALASLILCYACVTPSVG